MTGSAGAGTTAICVNARHHIIDRSFHNRDAGFNLYGVFSAIVFDIGDFDHGFPLCCLTCPCIGLGGKIKSRGLTLEIKLHIVSIYRRAYEVVMIRLCTHYNVPEEDDTKRLGAVLANIACAGDVICLFGELGAGKSTLARAFVRALCGMDTDVPSPTFTLIQGYDAPDFSIVHADLYRLEDPEDIIELGLVETFAEAVTLIEWPERLGRFLPNERLDLNLRTDSTGGRMAHLVAHGVQWGNRFES